MHPMERLRHVARCGPADPAVVMAETVEAIAGLRPAPAEMVNGCRQLVLRHPTCGPLWWLGAHLLHDGIERLWRLAEEIDEDPTSGLLAVALPEGATVVTIGVPPIAGPALARRAGGRVLAIEAGGPVPAFVRMLERSGVEASPVDPAAALGAVRAADVAVVEVGALAGSRAVGPAGVGLLTVLAVAGGVPVWVVAGRGRVLPGEFVAAMAGLGRSAEAAPWESGIELVELDLDPARDHLVTAIGAGPWPASGPAPEPECPFTPELIPPPSRIPDRGAAGA